LISNVSTIICQRDYSTIVEGIHSLDQIDDFNRMYESDSPVLYVVTNETQNVFRDRGVNARIEVPPVDKFGIELSGGEMETYPFTLDGHGFLSPRLVERALPNSYRDLSRLLEVREESDWVRFEELQAA